MHPLHPPATRSSLSPRACGCTLSTPGRLAPALPSWPGSLKAGSAGLAAPAALPPASWSLQWLRSLPVLLRAGLCAAALLLLLSPAAELLLLTATSSCTAADLSPLLAAGPAARSVAAAPAATGSGLQPRSIMMLPYCRSLWHSATPQGWALFNCCSSSSICSSAAGPHSQCIST
jgi:hypothetical protein